MGLTITGRMNIVKWLATSKDDGKWDGRELNMLAEAAKLKSKDSFSKTGARYATRIYNDPKTKYARGAKQQLFTLLVNEMGVDPAKVTGANDARSLGDFDALSKAGRFEFLKGAADHGLVTEDVSTYDIGSRKVRDAINAKESEVLDWADGYYRERWNDLGWDDFSLEGALEDDYAGFSVEKLSKENDTYGYVFTFTYNQGEMGTAYYFDRSGRAVGELDAGV